MSKLLTGTVYTYLVHCLHCSALFSAEKKPFWHGTHVFISSEDSGNNDRRFSKSLSDIAVIVWGVCCVRVSHRGPPPVHSQRHRWVSSHRTHSWWDCTGGRSGSCTAPPPSSSQAASWNPYLVFKRRAYFSTKICLNRSEVLSCHKSLLMKQITN